VATKPFTYVWEFDVPREREAEFERHYGQAGTWVKLFSRASGYLGTLLLKDGERPGRYLTVDRWESEAAYRAFRTQYASEYQALDLQCENLTSSEKSLGNFTE